VTAKTSSRYEVSTRRNSPTTINIPLYIVAPDKRREKVIIEINRPTFSRLEPGLNEICRFLSFSTVEELFKKFGADVRFLKPQILEEISEDRALSDAALARLAIKPVE
jgi:hypothetical protein